MRWNLLFLLVAALLLVSCGSETADKPEPVEAAEMTIAQLNAEAIDSEGKLVRISGTVDHVCRHGGKKMFVIGEDPDDRFKIDASDAVASFAVELEGSQVEVEGIVQVLKVDAEYLDNWEGEVCGYEHQGQPTAETAEATETEAAEGEEEGEHTAEEMAQINNLRQQLAESGEEYLGFYSLECKSYTEIH